MLGFKSIKLKQNEELKKQNEELKKQNEELKEQIKDRKEHIDELYKLIKQWQDEAYDLRRELELLKPIEQRSDIELANLALHTPLTDTWTSLWKAINAEIDKRYSEYMKSVRDK